MKTLAIACAMLAIGLTSCAQKKTQQNQEQPQSEPPQKTLVAYFSATGVTERVAKMIADVTGADLYRITPEQPYTAADLDWRNEQSRSSLEMKDPSSRLAIAGKMEDIKTYDVIYLGFPIWWYTAPTIINTFIESNDLHGISIVPFATSGGSTIDKACADLKAAYPDLYWQEGGLLNQATEDSVRAWVINH